jgi:hypothetical protein
MSHPTIAASRSRFLTIAFLHDPPLASRSSLRISPRFTVGKPKGKIKRRRRAKMSDIKVASIFRRR